MNTPIATRPLEYVCLFPADMPTLEGDVFMFFAIDAFSQFVFNTGVEKQLNDVIVTLKLEQREYNHYLLPQIEEEKTSQDNINFDSLEKITKQIHKKKGTKPKDVNPEVEYPEYDYDID